MGTFLRRLVYVLPCGLVVGHDPDVYTAAGNHFAPGGEIDVPRANRVTPLNERATNCPCFGITAITARVATCGLRCGSHFLLTVPGPPARQTTSRRAEQPNARYYLIGATERFWANWVVGDAVVHLFEFGAGNAAVPFQRPLDSTQETTTTGVQQPCFREPLMDVEQYATTGEPIDCPNGAVSALVGARCSPATKTSSLPSDTVSNVLTFTGRFEAISGYEVARCSAQ
jgi:hypothetical protein